MKKLTIIILLATWILSCKNEMEKSKLKFFVNEIPNSTPIKFKQDLIPPNKLVHKGIFSPNLEEYYYTISDQNFEHFDVYAIKKESGIWSEPQQAFFNSKYSEHGMSFSPDGNSIYFSSTRPVHIDGVAPTWHIWKSDIVDGKWNKPEFVDIPNLRNKLVSHPSVTNSGRIYFHMSNLDYSEMDIYYSKQVNGIFENADKLTLSMNLKAGKCTPYISPKEDYLLFASIGNQLDLMISFNDGNGGWKNTRKLSNEINNYGQGNPYMTPDNKFLFFTTGEHMKNNWSVKWVNMESELKNN
jgi:Tol biopolymer transport system component